MDRVYGSNVRLDTACILLALDQMFPHGYEGREFLFDMFIEHFQNTGIPSKYMHIIEECAPVKLLENDRWNISYKQGDRYIQIKSHNRPFRYLLTPRTPVIYIYEVRKELTHAVCITAVGLLHFLETTKYAGLLIPRQHIRDNIQHKG